MKTEAKHTAGGWGKKTTTTQDGNGGHHLLEVFNSKGRKICSKGGQGPITEEEEANFRLIAASPELLEMVHLFVNDLEKMDALPVLREMAGELLKKIEGE